MSASEELARPLVRNIGIDTIDVISGLAQFHSGFMSKVQKAADAYGIDVRRLIIELCKLDREKAEPSLIEKAASNVLQNTPL